MLIRLKVSAVGRAATTGSINPTRNADLAMIFPVGLDDWIEFVGNLRGGRSHGRRLSNK
jgi:hypothetical protein